MASQYRIQVVDSNGEVAVSWVPGSIVEQELISTLTAAIVAKGVGFLKTEATVRDRVVLALQEYLHSLKSAVKPPSQ